MAADPQLVEQARSPDPDARQRAAQTVSKQVNDRDYGLMFELLGDGDWRVRKTIVDGLARDPRPEVVDRLIDALADEENAGRRNSANEALMRMKENAVAPMVARLRVEPAAGVRASLANLLGDLRNAEGFAALLQQLPEERDVNAATAILGAIGKYRDAAALPHLFAVLKRDDLWLKFHAIEALGDIGHRDALPQILPLYSEKSLRKPILDAVAKIADVGTAGFLFGVLAGEEKLSAPALRALIAIVDASKPKVIADTERTRIQTRFRESFPKSKIEPLIQQLRATVDREGKSHLLRFLGWSHDEQALEPLIEHLRQSDTGEVAAQALIEFGPAAVPAVFKALQTETEEEPIALLLRVVKTNGSTDSASAVVPLLDHSSAMVRRLAIETLGDLNVPASVEYLLAKLDDPDNSSQQAAITAISTLVAAFPGLKKDVLAKIRGLVKSPSIRMRLNAVAVAVNIQGEAYHDELLLASKDSDSATRQKAITLMARYSKAVFDVPLIHALADESSAVRFAAIQTLGRLRAEKGLTPLINALDDEDIWIRTAAAQALGEYRHAEAMQPLLKHASSDEAPVRIAAIEALGKSGDPAARAMLLQTLADNDPEVRRAAVLALANQPGDEITTEIVKTLHNRDWRIRAAAVAALGMRGDRAALPHLQAAVDDADPYVQQSAVAALDKIPDRSSFPALLRGLDNRTILDDVCDVFLHHRQLFRDLLEKAWSSADRRREVVIAALLSTAK